MFLVQMAFARATNAVFDPWAADGRLELGELGKLGWADSEQAPRRLTA
ncbi:MAG: hypothetical protein ACRDP1_17320 [Nocardioidaceae bacterium]